jgi:hypothetical protein
MTTCADYQITQFKKGLYPDNHLFLTDTQCISLQGVLMNTFDRDNKPERLEAGTRLE